MVFTRPMDIRSAGKRVYGSLTSRSCTVSSRHLCAGANRSGRGPNGPRSWLAEVSKCARPGRVGQVLLSLVYHDHDPGRRNTDRAMVDAVRNPHGLAP
jgi:hypothetical protein